MPAIVVAPRSAGAEGLQFVRTWVQVLPDGGHPVGLSSPNVATLDGAPAVVVGDRAGYIYAFSLADGRPVPGWPASTQGIPVDSTPSVAALGGGSPDDTVFVGVGNASTPHEGGYEAFNADGTERWYVPVKNPSTDTSAGPTSAVVASLAVGDLQGGQLAVVAPSVGQEEYALDAATGAPLPGFPWFTSDSGFSTPALADLYGNGKTEIVEGGDQTAGLAYGVQYSRGGHLRVIEPTGTEGTGSPTGGLDCEYNPDQGVESSPAVGGFLPGGAPGIVVGTSHAFAGASDSDKVLAFNPQCQLVWQAALGGATESSPALADLEGNGALDVVEGTDGGPGVGSVYALAGATGSVIWSQQVGEVIGGVVTVDLGGGHQDVVVPTTQGADLLDGATGQPLTTIEQGVGLQSSPLVTDDPNGAIGITVAGYNGYNQGEVEHFELAGSSGADVAGPGAWPQFHHDPQLTGDAEPASGQGSLPQVAGPAQNPGSSRGCRRPAGGPNGYYEVGIAGVVYAFGNLARCGSLNVPPMAPAVAGISATPDGGGYWVVDRAGHVHGFGDAKVFAEAAGGQVSQVVSIASTPDGRGYWLAGGSGQVYAFGDAKLYPLHGSARYHGLAHVTSMAPAPDGHGYWLVTASGQVAAFGDAVAHTVPSPAHLSSIVGLAPDRATGGYWLVNERGEVYSFAAPFLGSVPAVAKERGISGIQATPGGTGYRLVDSGGALFCFGTATALGSAYAAHPARAVVGISAP
ncbi:MAG TPA: hypothetical protein VME20_14090 [Acidimicrobiales bacterium]|nr:hypothetical protein [Acidimicrobiales bacterium]